MAKRPFDDAPDPLRVSRRTFLRIVGVGAAATGLVGAAPHSAQAEILGPDAVPLALKLNGVTRTVLVEPRVTLLRALRNHLGLTGAKEVCERGACGAAPCSSMGSPSAPA